MMIPIRSYMKMDNLLESLVNVTSKVFGDVKRKLAKAPILHIPNLSKMFEVACDVSQVNNGVVLARKTSNYLIQ